MMYGIAKYALNMLSTTSKTKEISKTFRSFKAQQLKCKQTIISPNLGYFTYIHTYPSSGLQAICLTEIC